MVSGLEFSSVELGSGKSNTVVWGGPLSRCFHTGLEAMPWDGLLEKRQCIFL